MDITVIACQVSVVLSETVVRDRSCFADLELNFVWCFTMRNSCLQ